jgi:hypothetical protein
MKYTSHSLCATLYLAQFCFSRNKVMLIPQQYKLSKFFAPNGLVYDTMYS